MYHLQCFGGVSVQDDSGKQIRFRSRKHLALLLYLAVNSRQSHTRSRLASLLWSSDDEHARHSLSQALYDLRNKLSGAIPCGDGDHVRIDASQVRCAAVELEEAVTRGDLAHAVALYKGSFGSTLDHIGTPDYEYWVESERQRLDRLAQLALRRHVQESDKAARWGDMCVTAVKLLDMDPLDEEAHRALMRGLWLHGDRGSALRHYEQIAASLEKELGSLSPETVALTERIQAGASTLHFTRAGTDDAIPLIGRVKEFGVLRSVLDEVQEQGCRSIAVHGAPGIGKTRLVTEFKKCATLHPVTLLESQCYPAESHIPYGPVIDAMRPLIGEILAREPETARRYSLLPQLFPELTPYAAENQLGHVDAGAWQRRLYEEVADLLRCQTDSKPIVWVVEDVHWIDVTSRSLLHYVTRRLADKPFVLVQTTRALTKPELDRPEVLTETSFAPSSITLPPLKPTDIEEMLLRHRPDAAGHPAVELAQRLSGGNPFYALEVLRASIESTEWASEASDWDPLTDGRLSNVLATRFRGISRSGIRLLEAVAVLERHSRPTLLTEVAGVSLEEAAELSSEHYTKGLLRDVGDHVEFTHDLTREYLYAQLSALQRAALHSAAARVLEKSGLASEATLAGHFHLCEDRPKTYAHAMRAATEATASGGHSEAASMAALALESAATLQEKLQALNSLAEAELLSAQLESARTHFQQILDLDEFLTVEKRIELQLRIVEALAELSEWEAGQDMLRALTEQISNLNDPALQLENRFEALFWSLKIAMRQNDSASSRQIATTLTDLHDKASKTGDLSPVADVRARCGLAAYSLFFESAHAALKNIDCVAADRADLPPALSQRVRLLRGLVKLRLALWDEGEQELQSALAVAKKANDVVQISTLRNNLAASALEQGDWERFQLLASQVFDSVENLPAPLDVILTITLNRANASFYTGDARSAFDEYGRALELARTTGSHEFIPEIFAARGLTALQLGASDQVSQCWEVIKQLNLETLAGLQERFKIEWFLAYMTKSTNTKAAAAQLQVVAAAQDPLDVASSLKLRWIGHLLFRGASNAADKLFVQQQLKARNMVWFIGFARRWLRLTESKMQNR